MKNSKQFAIFFGALLGVVGVTIGIAYCIFEVAELSAGLKLVLFLPVAYGANLVLGRLKKWYEKEFNIKGWPKD